MKMNLTLSQVHLASRSQSPSQGEIFALYNNRTKANYFKYKLLFIFSHIVLANKFMIMR